MCNNTLIIKSIIIFHLEMSHLPLLFVVVVFSSLILESLGISHGTKLVHDKENEIATIIHEIPKIELHAHLHGSVRYSTLLELIHEQNLSKEIIKVQLDESDVGERDKPFELFPVVHRVVNKLSIVERVLREMVEDYLLENTIYLEIRTSPRGLSGDGSTASEYVRVITQTIASLNKQYSNKILSKLILSIDRSKSLQEGQAIYELAKQFQYVGEEKIIVGLDFAGNPQGGRFEDFQRLFETARRNGFFLTVHTAEAKELSESKLNSEDDETSLIINFS